jgi:hypothetical protein
VIDDEVPGVRREAERLAGERAVDLHGVQPGSSVDDVASGPAREEAVENALERVVPVAERDGLLPGARVTSFDEVVARAALNRDRTGRSRQEIVIAEVPDQRDPDVAGAEVADVAVDADEVVSGTTVFRDREVADAGAVHRHAVVTSTAKHPEPLDLRSVELRIDGAVEAEVHDDAGGGEGDVDDVAGCGSLDGHGAARQRRRRTCRGVRRGGGDQAASRGGHHGNDPGQSSKVRTRVHGVAPL